MADNKNNLYNKFNYADKDNLISENYKRLYKYKDSNRKIIEEPTTIYEVDNECILKNMNRKRRNKR